MAVVGDAWEMPGSPSATIEVGARECRREIGVKCSDMNDGPLVASTALARLGVVLFTPYVTPNESDLEALLRTISPERIRPGFAAWKFICEYSTPERKSGSGGDRNGGGGGTGRETPGEYTNPTLEIPTVKFTSSSREVLLTQIFDVNTGTLKPCTASNGEVFDPPPKTLERTVELTITRNERLTANHPAIGLMYQDAVNSDPFWGLPAGVWKVKSILAERQTRQIPNGGTVAFLRVEYSFEAKPLKIVNLSNLALPPANTIVSSWDLQLLDYGSYYYITPPPADPDPGALGFVAPNGNAQIKMHFKSREGHPTSGLLDGQGGALPDRVTFNWLGTQVKVPTTSYPFKVGMQVTVNNVGGTLPDPLKANGTYYVVSVTGTPLGTKFTIANQPGGTPIALSGGGTGTNFIGSPGVFLPVRPFARLPFGLLSLPQNFRQVQ